MATGNEGIVEVEDYLIEVISLAWMALGGVLHTPGTGNSVVEIVRLCCLIVLTLYPYLSCRSLVRIVSRGSNFHIRI